MGFSYIVCKKALQRTNNEGLDKALDIIFEVAEEEKLIIPPPQKNLTLKPEW